MHDPALLSIEFRTVNYEKLRAAIRFFASLIFVWRLDAIVWIFMAKDSMVPLIIFATCDLLTLIAYTSLFFIWWHGHVISFRMMEVMDAESETRMHAFCRSIYILLSARAIIAILTFIIPFVINQQSRQERMQMGFLQIMFECIFGILLRLEWSTFWPSHFYVRRPAEVAEGDGSDSDVDSAT